MQKNYPSSKILANEIIKTNDGKLKYSQSMRSFILKKIKSIILQYQINASKLYFCMENI